MPRSTAATSSTPVAAKRHPEASAAAIDGWAHPMVLGVARAARVAYNVPLEFCFRARWKSSLAVSTAAPLRAGKPATLRESAG